MKTRKVFSFAAAAVLAVSSLPVWSAGAAEPAYALGDVDMDGVITGHDSALVSRAVFVGDVTLTEEQKTLADVNSDGVLDAADTEWIHENEVYPLGWMISNDEFTDKENLGCVTWRSPWYAFITDSYQRIGAMRVISSADNGDMTSWTYSSGELLVSEVQYNLLDANADGVLDYNDAYAFLLTHGWYCLGMGCYVGDGNYMFNGCK